MKTLGTKVNEDTYRKFQELSEKQDVTVSENMRNLVEDSLTNVSDHDVKQIVKPAVIELPRDIDTIIDNCVTCEICLAYLDKSLQRHGLELVDLTGKYFKTVNLLHLT
ncbi:MAG TPA: hypothetical protein VJ571_05510 [Candidatus Nitrosotalea sp.]|nr:hypothetical protein [Candidatus Nitrosotalea sp.]